MRTHVVERMKVHPESLFYHEHVARYRFAETHLRPGPTLDLACGSGYGTDRLSRLPGVRAFGADIDLPSLHACRVDYPNHGVNFLAASGPRLPFSKGFFQNIVTLETIEHIEDDRGYLRELLRTLRPDGVCILSTPNCAYSQRQNIVNPYHVREYSESGLMELLQSFFGKVELFYQGFSARYHEQLSDYTVSIQTRKKQNRMAQFAINTFYRPIKRLIPAGMANFFIHRWLGLKYPQPAVADINISDHPSVDTSVFIAVCHQPCPSCT
jgi:SAM-dependent methyltransferase